MQYKSPISILLHFIGKTDNLMNLDYVLLKKRILAEFELSGKSTIITKAREFSKNDILTIFENIKLNDNLDYHLTIAKYPALLHFLEHNEPIGKMLFNEPCFNNFDFLNFVSPYLANSTGNFFADCIRNPNLPIHYIKHSTFPVLNKHYHLLFEPVNEAVEEIVSQVESFLSLFKVTDRLNDVTGFFSDEIIRVFNFLLKYHFATAIDLYATCGIDLIAAMSQSKSYCRKQKFVIDQLLKLNVSTEIKDKINSYSGQTNATKAKTESESSSNGGSSKLTFFIVLAIIGVFRYVINESNNDRYNSLPSENNIDLNYILERSRRSYDSINRSSIEKLLENEKQLDSLDRAIGNQKNNTMSDSGFKEKIKKITDSTTLINDIVVKGKKPGKNKKESN